MNKPRLVKRLDRWWCSDRWHHLELIGTIYHVRAVDLFQIQGYSTPEEAYNAWYENNLKNKHPVKYYWNKFRRMMRI